MQRLKESKSGIYQLEINGKFYIGSAKNLDARIYRHLWDLRKNRHCNLKLQRAFNKYGEDSFNYKILEYVDTEKLISEEQYYIDTLNPFYNICRVAGNTMGVLHSEETKRYLSKIRKGKQTSLGRVMSEETRKKIGEKARLRGIPDVCVKAAIAKNTGSKRSQETILKAILPQAKLSKEDVVSIMQLLEKHCRQADIAKQYGVSQRVICRVNNRIGVYGLMRDEIDKDYFDAQEKRFQAHIAQTSLFDKEAP